MNNSNKCDANVNSIATGRGDDNLDVIRSDGINSTNVNNIPTSNIFRAGVSGINILYTSLKRAKRSEEYGSRSEVFYPGGVKFRNTIAGNVISLCNNGGDKYRNVNRSNNIIDNADKARVII